MKFLETVKADDGHLFHLNYHQKRLDRSMASLGSHVGYELKDLLKPPQSGLYRCRILYNSATISIEYLPYTARTFHSLQAVIDDDIDYHFKYAKRERLDELFTQRDHCDDVVIVQHGMLTDTTVANIALYDGNRWVTPTSPLLEGTTRARLLDVGKLTEAEISIETLDRFYATAIMNAMLGFVQVENGIIMPKQP